MCIMHPDRYNAAPLAPTGRRAEHGGETHLEAGMRTATLRDSKAKKEQRVEGPQASALHMRKRATQSFAHMRASLT